VLYDGRTVHRVTLEHIEKLRDILGILDRSRKLQDVDLPGLRLHSLKGELKDYYAVTASGSWRVIFRFEDSDVADVDSLNYH